MNPSSVGAPNLDEVNQEIMKSIDDQETIRIVADIPIDLLQADDYMGSASEMIQPLVSHWETKHTIRVLVVDVYPRHAYVVVDINNHRYDFDEAHKQKFAIPVYLLRLSRRKKTWTFFRYSPQDQRLANQLAEVHRSNGQNPTPFFSDHINNPVSLTIPRTPHHTFDGPVTIINRTT